MKKLYLIFVLLLFASASYATITKTVANRSFGDVADGYPTGVSNGWIHTFTTTTGPGLICTYASNTWKCLSASTGSSGGGVQSVTATGPNITVNNADPVNPVVGMNAAIQGDTLTLTGAGTPSPTSYYQKGLIYGAYDNGMIWNMQNLSSAPNAFVGHVLSNDASTDSAGFTEWDQLSSQFTSTYWPASYGDSDIYSANANFYIGAPVGNIRLFTGCTDSSCIVADFAYNQIKFTEPLSVPSISFPDYHWLYHIAVEDNCSGMTSTAPESSALSIHAGGTSIDIAAGSGHINDHSFNAGSYLDIDWNAQTVTCGADGANYIAIDSTSTATISTTKPSMGKTVFLGFAYCQGGGVLELFNLPEWAEHFPGRVNDLLQNSIGSLVSNKSGALSVTEAATPLHIQIANGDFRNTLTTVSIPTTTVFTKMYNSTSGWQQYATNSNAIDTNYYNDISKAPGSALVSLDTGSWAKGVIMMTPSQHAYFIYGQTQYATQDLAKAGAIPTVPDDIVNGSVFLAAIVYQKGDTSISSRLLDIRPSLSRIFGSGTTVGSSGAVVDWSTIINKPAAVTSLSGVNTGDQDLSAYALSSFVNTTVSGLRSEMITTLTNNYVSKATFTSQVNSLISATASNFESRATFTSDVNSLISATASNFESRATFTADTLSAVSGTLGTNYALVSFANATTQGLRSEMNTTLSTNYALSTFVNTTVNQLRSDMVTTLTNNYTKISDIRPLSTGGTGSNLNNCTAGDYLTTSGGKMVCSTPAGGSGYNDIAANGASQTHRTNLNFIQGAGITITASDATPTTNITISSSASAPTFDQLQGGINTTATMTVGAGSKLVTSTTGTIRANEFTGNMTGLGTAIFDGDIIKMGNTDTSKFYLGSYTTGAGTLATLLGGGDFAHLYFVHNAANASGTQTTADDATSTGYAVAFSDLGLWNIYQAPAGATMTWNATPTFSMDMIRGNLKVSGALVTNNTGSISVAAGKSFAVNNGLTLAGTDGTTMTFPASSGTVAMTGADINASNQVTVTHLAAALPIAQGGTNNGSLAVTNGNVLYADGTKITSVNTATPGYSLHTNGAGAPNWQSSPSLVYTTATQTYTSTTGAIVTGLSWSIGMNSYQRFECLLTSSTMTTASSPRYGVAVNSSPTLINFQALKYTTSLTAPVGENIAGAWASTCTNCTAAVTSGVAVGLSKWKIEGELVSSATGTATVAIYAAVSTTNTGTIGVNRGSSCTYWAP